MMQPGAAAAPGAAWGGEEEAAGEGGGGLQLAPPVTKRQRNPRLDALLQQRAAKRTALAAKKLAAQANLLAPASPLPVVAKRERGRPSGWVLRPDAPEFLSLEEFNALSTKQLQMLWGDYYAGCATQEAGSKSGNRKYLKKKLTAAGDEFSTLSSGALGA